MKQPCWKCNGTGIVQNEGRTAYEITCAICGGSGFLDDMGNTPSQTDAYQRGFTDGQREILDRWAKEEMARINPMYFCAKCGKELKIKTKKPDCATGDDLSCTD